MTPNWAVPGLLSNSWQLLKYVYLRKRSRIAFELNIYCLRGFTTSKEWMQKLTFFKKILFFDLHWFSNLERLYRLKNSARN